MMPMSTPPEFPRPAQVPGEPAPPCEPHEIHRARVPDVVDDDTDLFGVEDAAARLTERLGRRPTRLIVVPVAL
jgi:hypothetical protein